MRWDKLALWLILAGELVSSALIAAAIYTGGRPMDHLFSFSRFASQYWWLITGSVNALCSLAAVFHAIFSPRVAIWQRILWALAIYFLRVVAVPLYCLTALRRSERAVNSQPPQATPVVA
jgi:hypothetical protein